MGDRDNINRSSSWSCQGWALQSLGDACTILLGLPLEGQESWANFHCFQYCPSYFLLSSNPFPKVSCAEYKNVCSAQPFCCFHPAASPAGSTQFLLQQLDPGSGLCVQRYKCDSVALDRSLLMPPAVCVLIMKQSAALPPSLTILASC